MTDPVQPNLSYAIVTPSFRGDYERCELLCESMRQFAPPDASHYLVVDRRDKPMFSSLASGKTHILIAEDVIGFWCRRIPRMRRWWITQYGFPVRNWILQQLVKLAVAETLHCDFYMFIDSDVCLVNYLDMSRFVASGKVALFRVLMPRPGQDAWHTSAREILGVREPLRADRGYVGNLITWRREIVQAMYARIQAVHRTSWQFQILRRLHFSEYTLYGRFVDDLTIERTGHFADSSRRCHEFWGNDDASSLPRLDSFFDAYDPAWPSIMISSKAGIAVNDYRRRIEQMWRLNRTRAGRSADVRWHSQVTESVDRPVSA